MTNDLLKPEPLDPKTLLGLKELQQIGFWNLTRNNLVVTIAIDLGVQAMFDALQSEAMDAWTTMGGLKALTNAHTSEFKAAIEFNCITHLKNYKSGKWGTKRQSEHIEEACVGAASQLTNNILQVVAGKDYIWPKAYEEYLDDLIQDKNFRAEMEINPACVWQFLDLAKKSFILGVPLEHRKSKPEMQSAGARLEEEMKQVKIENEEIKAVLVKQTKKIAELASAQQPNVLSFI